MSEGSEDEVVRSLIGRLVHGDLAGGRNALVVIDLQVLDAAVDGEHAERAREQGRWDDVAAYFDRVADLVAPNVRRLASALRERSQPVIYVRCRSLTPDARDNGRRFRDFGIAVGSDDPQAAILPALEVLPGDFVLDKTTASPFWSTAIERLLAQLGVENLFVTGVVTSGCVEGTVRDACDLDYRVVLVEDACADRQPDLHADAVRRLNNNFAVVMPTAAVLGAVGAAALEKERDMTPSFAARLRAMIEGESMPLLPGAYDGVSARLIARAGFPAIYFSGGLSASSFPGVPDFGTRTLSEAVAQVGGAVRSTGLPILADAEAGFGSVLTIQRLIWEMESVGAAGIHLEDQDVPRRCGHYADKRLVSTATHVGRLEAALESRRDPDFVIIARTDAVSVTGFEDAIERSRAYLEAGADVAFLDGVETLEQLRSIPSLIDGPVMANMVEGGVTPFLSAGELEALGYAIAIYPCSAYFAAVGAMRDVLGSLRDEGTSEPRWPAMGTFREWQELTGVDEAMEFVRRFEPEEEHAEL